MPGPGRINYLSLFCSCVGQAALLGGIMFGLSDFRKERAGFTPSGLPLVVEMIPLTTKRGTVPGADAPHPADPPARQAHSGMADVPRSAEALPEPTTPVVGPGLAPGPVPAAAAAPDQGAKTASDFSDYQHRLYAALARSSRYPAEARRMHLAGVTQLAFAVDRGGTVLESWIQGSSGSQLLDDAALDALTRAQPLPPIPAGLPSRLEFVIEIDLSIMEHAGMQTAGRGF